MDDNRNPNTAFTIRSDIVHGVTAFATGFLISLLLYVMLRLIGTKWIFNFLSTLFLGYALFGMACGAMAHARISPVLWRRYEPWMYIMVLIQFLCTAYNYNLSATYLLPVNGFALYTPEKLGLHITAEALFFILLPAVYMLLGYYFAACFQETGQPYGVYAAHISGFFFGGLAGYCLVLTVGAAAAMAAAIGAMIALFLARRRMVYALLFFVATGAILVYSRHSPKLFFTWSVRDYKTIESTWTPYYKLDFIVADDNEHCMAGIYNNLFACYACDTPNLVHLQLRQIYKELAKGRRRILVIGGSMGVAMSYLARLQDSMELGVSLDVDPVLTRHGKNRFARYNGYVLRRKNVEAVAMEGRRFLTLDKRKYDLIFLDGLDNHLYFSPGSLVAVENYMFTREGLAAVFDHLAPDGIVTMDLGGTTSVDYLGQFLGGLPRDVDYELFWYVVPDRPMVGLALYHVVASRDEAALRRATRHMKSLPSLIYIPYKPRLHGAVPTDNRPILESWERLVVIFGGGFLLICLAAAAIWRSRYKARHGAPSSFPFMAFAALGFFFMIAESAVALKHARLFSGPALGMVLLTSVFLMGNFCVNVAFVWLRRARSSFLTRLSVIPAVAAFGLLILNAQGGVTAPAPAVALVLLAGMATGWFWPLLLRILPGVDRRRAFAADTLGAVAGSVVFFFTFLTDGFPFVSLFAAVGFLVLLIYIILYVHPAAGDAGG